MDLLQRITKFRDERGWTNNRMSVEAGVSSATVINWYKRGVTPEYKAIVALSDAFGVTLAEFFNDEPERISLSKVQKDLLSQFDLLNKAEKDSLVHFITTMNDTKKLR